MNLGASAPEELGMYFSWGNTDGHERGTGYVFSTDNYNNSPARAIESDLTLEQDAAAVELGQKWRMPSTADFKELVENCDYEWVTEGDASGLLFTSRTTGNSIFLRAAGMWTTGLVSINTGGYYWARTYKNSRDGMQLLFHDNSCNPEDSWDRYRGLSIRPVWDPSL